MVGSVSVREARPSDADAWCALRSDFWPDSPEDHPSEIAQYFAEPPDRWICLVATEEGGPVLGFAEVGMRDYAERCRTSPVGYLEGIYVVPTARGEGVGRALFRAGQEWARGKGCTEMASDREIENEVSAAFHKAVGFDEAIRIVCYRQGL